MVFTILINSTTDGENSKKKFITMLFKRKHLERIEVYSNMGDKIVIKVYVFNHAANKNYRLKFLPIKLVYVKMLKVKKKKKKKWKKH